MIIVKKVHHKIKVIYPKYYKALKEAALNSHLGRKDKVVSGRLACTGTPPLTRFFGPRKNRVKGKPRYSWSILVLKPQNREYESSKSKIFVVF